MKHSSTDGGQTAQRVRVGMIGLAAVILLIGLASALLTLVSRERPVSVAGGSNASVVANLSLSNTVEPDGIEEPLAELGVAPGAAVSNTASSAP